MRGSGIRHAFWESAAPHLHTTSGAALAHCAPGAPLAAGSGIQLSARMTRKAIPIEDLTPEEIARIEAFQVDMTGGEDLEIHRGSGCLWTDLGYPNPAEMSVKSALAHRVNEIVRGRGWSPIAAAEATGLGVEVFAHADRGQLSRISVGDLIEALTRLGAVILICVVEAQEGERGATLVRSVEDDD